MSGQIVAVRERKLIVEKILAEEKQETWQLKMQTGKYSTTQ
jgi:hypothetical protein